jgi:putative transposase
MLTTYRFKLYPSKLQQVVFAQDQQNACFVKNRMIGDREFTYHQQFILGDYCRLYDKSVFYVSTLRSSLGTQALGSGLYCSVNRNASLGGAWKTGDSKRARPSKKVTLNKDDTVKAQKLPSLRRTASDMQCNGLTVLKKQIVSLQETSAGLLQNAVKQVDIAFSRFFTKKSNHPQYKKAFQIGMHYPDSEVKLDTIVHKVYLPGVGWVRFKNSRPFWDEMTFSKFQVRKDCHDWYLSIVVRDDTISAPKMIRPEAVKTIVGGDKGINKLLSVSGEAQFMNPRFAESESRRMRIRQRRISRKQKGSKNKVKAAKQVAVLHQKIRRRREDYHWKVAKKFVSLADANAVEALNVKGMMKRCKPKKDESGQYIKNGQAAKSGLSRSIADAAWYGLDQKIKQQSLKQGKLNIPVEPHHTSQECPKCHHIDASNRDGEKFICLNCGHVDDADNNAGTNIAVKAIRTAQLNKKVRVVSSEFTPQIKVRRDHQHRLVSRGSRKHNGSTLDRLRHTERQLLNSWIQALTCLSDSHSVTLVQDG